ncbi:MAG: phage tail protein [Pseudomonadota bacterium]
MATLLLTAVGTAIGGPLGGAIGAFVGQQADQAIFGSGSRDGPRLKELSVTTSSYGQAIPRQFGRMRVAGTVIWATELVESASTEGGKGQPTVTTYSYSASLAVALSSTPIKRVGRIWADGNLLRGANEDLKVGGQLRVYLGQGDSAVDPLISADKGTQAPAFRDCAYVVFEDLQLADYGNRIPALTFEVFAESESSVSLKQVIPKISEASDSSPLSHTRGFSDEGGPLSATLSAIDRVFPINCATTHSGLRISSDTELPSDVPVLPEQLSTQSSQDARERNKIRAESAGQEPMALRYYDEDRDYQPGVQRALGLRPSGRERMVDLPATMTAHGAKALANDNAHRARWRRESIIWRVGELNPSVQPGSVVKLPKTAGFWRVKSWEWYDRGIELNLQRLAPGTASETGSHTGDISHPVDVAHAPTHLNVFEVPPEDSRNPSSRIVLAAATSVSASWNGAALYAEQGDALIPIGSTGALRSVSGLLKESLEPSPAHFFEADAAMTVELFAADLSFSDTDITGLAAGANRMLIGSEVVQFLNADALGEGRWRLRGLLRGRAGTEEHARLPHPVDSPIVSIDARLTDLSSTYSQSDPSRRIAAIGRGDDEAVYATLSNAGLSRRPPTPVHPKITRDSSLNLSLCWTRRARGQWRWDTEGEVPLVEETEAYLVGYGPVDSPLTAYSVTEPRLVLTEAEQTALVFTNGPGSVWVKQVGTFSSSNALFLTELA